MAAVPYRARRGCEFLRGRLVGDIAIGVVAQGVCKTVAGPVEPGEKDLAVTAQRLTRLSPAALEVGSRHECLEVALHERVEQVPGNPTVGEFRAVPRVEGRPFEAEEIADALVVAQYPAEGFVPSVRQPALAVDEHERPLPGQDRPADLTAPDPAADSVARPVERAVGLIPRRSDIAAKVSVPRLRPRAEGSGDYRAGVAALAGGIGVRRHAQGFHGLRHGA